MSNSSGSSGIGFGGLLTVLFIGLKLGGIIAWSWWWVLSPLWIGFIFWIIVFGIIFGALGVDNASFAKKKRKGLIPEEDWSWPGKRKK